MSFTVSDFDDLKRLLGEHPEWRVELRRLLLTDDMEALPGIVRELAEAQRRAEERLGGVEDRLSRLEQAVNQLAEAQRGAEARLEGVEDRLARAESRLEGVESRLEGVEDRLARAESRLEGVESRLAGVEDRLTGTELAIQQLVVAQRETAEHLRRLTDKVGAMDGVLLESDYARKVPSYFGQWLRRAKAADLGELWDQLESHLGHEDTRYALLADLVVRGRVAQLADRPDAYLVVEISAVIDDHDVERAIRRAELFRRAGLPAIPAVAGREATGAAKALAEGRGVAMLQDGQEFYWDQALTHWPTAGV